MYFSHSLWKTKINREGDWRFHFCKIWCTVQFLDFLGCRTICKMFSSNQYYLSVVSFSLKDKLSCKGLHNSWKTLITRSHELFLIGNEFWAVRGQTILPRYPQKLYVLGFSKDVTKIDAAFYDRKRESILLHSGQILEVILSITFLKWIKHNLVINTLSWLRMH